MNAVNRKLNYYECINNSLILSKVIHYEALDGACVFVDMELFCFSTLIHVDVNIHSTQVKRCASEHLECT